jgi:two-component system, chemotaxis family, chemotaxis protein CheY
MRNILIVDEDEQHLETTVTVLGKTQRYTVEQANTGHDAYQKSRNKEFDIIITDYEVPRLMGKELVNSFRENKDNVATPILFYSDKNADAKIELDGYQHVHYLDKPCKPDELLAKIEDLVIMGIETKLDFNIDVEVINPFIEATLEVLKDKCGITDVDYSRPKTISAASPRDVVTSVSIVSKYFTGKLSTCFSEESFLKLAGAFSNTEIDKLNDETKDIATEIINEIFNLANKAMTKKQFKLKEAIPAIIEPKDLKIVNNNFEHNLGIIFKTNIGNILYVINVQKQKAK